MTTKIIRLQLLVFVALLLFKCSSNSDDNPAPVVTDDGKKTVLPDDVTKLYIEKGNKNSDKAILYCQGGPNDTLKSHDLEDLDLEDHHLIYVHQANTYNKNLFNIEKKILTFDRAKRENDVSIEILYRVAKHFKDKGKKVYIVGHSFGAFLIPLFIETKDFQPVKYLIMAGRLDMNEIVWQGFKDSKYFQFKDGLTPEKFSIPSNTPNEDIEKKRLSAQLQAAIGEKRFTQLLKDNNLSNVIYAYGTHDKAVGRLITEEVNFLKSKDAHVHKIENGGHSDMFKDPDKTTLKNLLLQ